MLLGNMLVEICCGKDIFYNIMKNMKNYENYEKL